MQRFAWCTFLPVLAFFSFSHTQLPHYLLYGLSPMFLLLALHRRRFAAPWWTIGPALAGLALAAALPWLAAQASGRVAKPILKLLLDDFARTMTTLVVPALAALGALAVIALLTTRLALARRADARLVRGRRDPGAVHGRRAVAAGHRGSRDRSRRRNRHARHRRRRVECELAELQRLPRRRHAGAAPAAGETVLTRADRASELPPHDVVLARREVLVARVRP